ncbi:MAG TPA: replicative DNA helicase [Magnetospirillaceae bacterium]|jgi:replicative DNA helicase
MLKPIPLPDTGADVPVRVPPHNFEAEQALLGAILLNNRAIERVSEFLRTDHFAEPLHGRIYEACVALAAKNQIASAITLKSWLGHDPDLIAQGGDGYLARLVGGAATIINAYDYGRLIYDLHLRRELIALGEEMVNEAFVPQAGEGARRQVESAEARLFDLATQGQAEGGFVGFRETLIAAVHQAEAAHKREGKLSGVTTGLRDLDRKLGGMHRSDLIILAGRPSMGKTALATNIAFNAAKAFREEVSESGEKETVEGGRVAFFSLEMSAEQLATRIIAERAEIPSHKVRQGELSHVEFERLVSTAQELHSIPIFIDDTPALSVSAVRTRARRLQRTQGLDMIVIDYLQLLSSSHAGGGRFENRVQEISDITRGLKALAKELDVPILALSQLSRAVESRDDKKPQLADLRESGSIEQDSDVVLLIFREQYYLERAEPGRKPDETDDKYAVRYADWQARAAQVHNTAEVIVAKQRHGPVGSVKLFFDGQFTKFADLDEQHGGDFGPED